MVDGPPAASMLIRAQEVVHADEIAGVQQYRDDGIEVNVRAVTEAGEATNAYLDRLLISGDGELIVDDWKTGKVNGAKELQLALYAWSVEQTTGIAVGQARFIYLRAAKLEARIVPIDLPRFLPLVEPFAAQTTAGIEAGARHPWRMPTSRLATTRSAW